MSLIVTYKEDKSLLDKCGHGFNFVTGSVAFDSSYPTGGEAMDMSKVFPTSVHIVLFETKAGYIFEYDYTNKKVKAKYPTKTQAVANSGANQLIATSGAATASAVDATTPHITAPAGFRSAVDPGVAEEVANAADLSALTDVRFLAIGR
jgi:hypothetical protein